MKTNALLALLVSLVIAVGCGGSTSGGGGGNGNGNGSDSRELGTQAPKSGQYLEFIDSNGRNIDPYALRPGESITVQAVNYDSQGNRSVLPVTSWFLVGGAGNAVLNNGVLTLSGSTGVFKVEASALLGATPVSLARFGRASSNTTIVTGRVVGMLTGAGVKYVELTFYDSLGVQVGGALTGDDGYFYGVVPATARGVNGVKGSIDTTTYYKLLKYQGTIYTMGTASCAIVIPAPIAGNKNPLPSTLRLPEVVSGPPPPPGGCGS